MPSSATGVGMPICLLGGVLLILTQKNSQKFGDVLGIFYRFCHIFYYFKVQHLVSLQNYAFFLKRPNKKWETA